jgi:hypothetical protein
MEWTPPLLPLCVYVSSVRNQHFHCSSSRCGAGHMQWWYLFVTIVHIQASREQHFQDRRLVGVNR